MTLDEMAEQADKARKNPKSNFANLLKERMLKKQAEEILKRKKKRKLKKKNTMLETPGSLAEEGAYE